MFFMAINYPEITIITIINIIIIIIIIRLETQQSCLNSECLSLKAEKAERGRQSLSERLELFILLMFFFRTFP